MLSWRGTSFELAISSYSGSSLWKLPSSTAPGPDITSLFQRKVPGLPLRQSVRPFRGWSSSGGGSRRWSARNRESTQCGASRVKFGGASRESRPSEVFRQEVSRRKQKLGVLKEKRKEWRQSAAVDRKRESTENGVEGVKTERTQARGVSLKPGPGGRRPWWLRFASSCAQAASSANNSWSTVDAAASLQLQKASEGGLSVETFGVHVLLRRERRPCGDLVREVLRTSNTIVKASGIFVRQ